MWVLVEAWHCLRVWPSMIWSITSWMVDLKTVNAFKATMMYMIGFKSIWMSSIQMNKRIFFRQFHKAIIASIFTSNIGDLSTAFSFLAYIFCKYTHFFLWCICFLLFLSITLCVYIHFFNSSKKNVYKDSNLKVIHLCDLCF